MAILAFHPAPITLCVLHFTLRHCTYLVKSFHNLCVLEFCKAENYSHIRIITLLPFFIEMLQYDWLWSCHMIIKEMIYIPIKLKPEFARASMTMSDVNNQWRSNFQQQIISDNMKQPAAILVLQVLYTILVFPVFYQNLPVSAILVQILVNTSIPVSSRIFQYLQY